MSRKPRSPAPRSPAAKAPPRSPKAARGASSDAGEVVGKALGVEGDLRAPVTAVLAAGGAFALTTGDGRLIVVSGCDLDGARSVEAHTGVILSAAVVGDGTAVVTGGDDGRVTITALGGASDDLVATELWRSERHRWIDHVAARADGTIAWTSGKSVHVRGPDCDTRAAAIPTAAGGLAFAPQSDQLAIAHYGGVTVWNLAPDHDTTQLFAWKGSHLDVRWSPDEAHLMTAMPEGAVHGWRLADGSDFAMRGYPGKPRALAFSRTGAWLATSGAFEAVLWPFVGTGPAGKAPLQLARRTHLTSAVAFHPLNDYVAIGYQDGVVLLARVDDRRELAVRTAGGGEVVALAWSSDGKRLAFGSAEGAAGVVDFSALGGR